MEIGLLTAPLGRRSLEWAIGFAKDNGFPALEVAAGPGSNHLDTSSFTARQADEVKRLLQTSGVRISSLAFYTNLLDPDKARRNQLSKDMRGVIKAAQMLDVGVVCTLAGMPMPGKSKLQTLEEDFPGVLRPLVQFAGEREIKLAFENWYATNLQGLDTFARAFEVVPEANLGLNFDPSHLLWQGIDYLEAVDMFKARIFHTHAKDTEVKQHVLRHVGCLAGGWWRYVIPGYGEVDWPVYIARLRSAGYNDVLSIEHEDSAFGVEEGFIKGQRYLAQYV